MFGLAIAKVAKLHNVWVEISAGLPKSKFSPAIGRVNQN